MRSGKAARKLASDGLRVKCPGTGGSLDASTRACRILPGRAGVATRLRRRLHDVDVVLHDVTTSKGLVVGR